MAKQIVLGLLILTLCITGFTGCNKEPYDVEFENEALDFGTLEEGEAVIHLTYKFKNTGTETLKIFSVDPACGCTIADNWDKEVAPGKTGEIPITFNSLAQGGDIEKHIHIKTNIPEREEIDLLLTGKVINAIQLNPRSTWLGDIVPDKLKTPLRGVYEIRNTTAQKISVKDVVLFDKNASYNLQTIEEGEVYRLNVTVNPPFDEGDVVKKDIAITIGGEKERTFKLSYSYYVQPPIQVNPKIIQVDLSKSATGRSVQRINIKSNIEKPIAIKDLKIEGADIRFTEEVLLKDKFYQIALEFPQGFAFPQNSQSATISFRIENDPSKILYSIPIEALNK